VPLGPILHFNAYDPARGPDDAARVNPNARFPAPPQRPAGPAPRGRMWCAVVRVRRGVGEGLPRASGFGSYPKTTAGLRTAVYASPLENLGDIPLT